MKKFSLLLFIIIVLAGCSIGGKSKPNDVRQEVWDDGIQMTIAINEAIENEDAKMVVGVNERIREWEEEELSEKEQDIKKKILDLHMDALSLQMIFTLGLEVDEEDKSEYNESYKLAQELFGKSNLSAKNLDEDFIQKMATNGAIAEKESEQKQADKEKKDFITKTSISVTSDEVQYNMPNNLDKEFYLEGTVELDDYYNYGFTYEEDYFCGKLTPFDGGYSDSWYLYFDRDSFDSLYTLLLEGSRDLRIAAEIPEYMYEKGQGRMAYVKRTGAY